MSPGPENKQESQGRSGRQVSGEHQKDIVFLRVDVDSPLTAYLRRNVS